LSVNTIYENMSAPNTFTQILCFLAKNGPTNIYQVSKGTRITYSTTHKFINEIETLKLIKLERVERSQKGGEAKVYGLTLLGLCWAFGSQELFKGLDSIIAKWKHLDPLLLGNWKHLVSIGPYEEAVEALKGATESICRFAQWGAYEVGAVMKDEDLQIPLWNEFSGRLIGVFSDHHRERWIEAIRSVPILNDWHKELCQKSLLHNQSLVHWDSEVLRALKGEKVDFKDATEQLERSFEGITRTYFKSATEEFVKKSYNRTHLGFH